MMSEITPRSRKPRQEKLPLVEKLKHGGFRKGAGRPKSDFLTHKTRETITGKHPLHITFKIKAGLPSLRQKRFYQAFKKSVLKAQNKGLRLLQFSILSNHVHMIVEISDNKTLHAALKSLNTAFAKRVNFLVNRIGAVLRERFHLHILRTPQEYKNALKYVLLNFAKHDGKNFEIDLYSSAVTFNDFDLLLKRAENERLKRQPWQYFVASLDTLEAMLATPLMWLSRGGWQKSIKFRDFVRV